MRTLGLIVLMISTCLGLTTAEAQSVDVDTLRQAYRFAFPVYEIARTRWQAVGDGGGGGSSVPVNAFNHGRKLANADTRFVTTPNNDTLYSTAFIDLAAGPVLLDMPAKGHRYVSVALLDIYTDNVAVLGGDARHPRRYLIAGPSWKGLKPKGVQLVRATTNDGWLIARILVEGPEDLAAARVVQDGLGLHGVGDRHDYARVTNQAPAEPDAERLLAVVNEMLGRSPISSDRIQHVASFSAAGIKPGTANIWAELPETTRQAWNENLPKFREEMKAALRSARAQNNGWIYPRSNLGRFGSDDAYRAVVALGGLGALPMSEAVYVSALADAQGQSLDGSKSYRLIIPAGSVTDEGFWSLSMYDVMSDGRLYFTHNPIERYSIGDRTPGLRRNADGSVEILIQHDRPTDDTNWLPAPVGSFRPLFRAYLPNADLIDGRFKLPALEQSPGR